MRRARDNGLETPSVQASYEYLDMGSYPGDSRFDDVKHSHTHQRALLRKEVMRKSGLLWFFSAQGIIAYLVPRTGLRPDWAHFFASFQGMANSKVYPSSSA